MPLTVLVDYDSGNLHSAEKAFQRMALEVGAGEIIVSAYDEPTHKVLDAGTGLNLYRL